MGHGRYKNHQIEHLYIKKIRQRKNKWRINSTLDTTENEHNYVAIETVNRNCQK